MDDYLDGGEFWLLPGFLSDDNENHNPERKATRSAYCNSNTHVVAPAHPYSSVDGFGSFRLESPSETEIHEEDFLTGLTRRMARSKIRDDPRKAEPAVVPDNSKASPPMATSPQSTLGIMDCGDSQGSSRGSPNGRSRPSSPPATWDVLHAAAGEVQRIKTSEEGTGYFDGARGISDRYKKCIPLAVPVPGTGPSFNYGRLYDHRQVQASQQLTTMKQQQQRKHGVWGKQPPMVPNQNKARNKSSKPLGLSTSAWPPLLPQAIPQPQQPKGSAMRAVFLDPPANRRGCPGTGVFLPRQVGTTAVAAEPRRKSGCSTVLLPARVVQALNLNLEEIGAQPRSVAGFVGAGGDVSLKLRSNRSGGVHAQEKRNLRQTQAAAAAAPNPELRLPQEWTY